MNQELSSVTRRPAQMPTDEAFLRELFDALHHSEFEVLALPEPMLKNLLDLQFRAQNASYSTQFPAGVHEIILLNARPVGRIWTNFAFDQIRLVDLALLPAHQNLGIGSALIEELLQAATSARPLRLSVAVTNVRAQNLYRKLGLQVTASDEVYRQMQWPLSTPVSDD